MNNYRCILAYCGFSFYGFKSTEMGPNIEDTLRTCLERILQHPIEIQGASLTDRGVHAEGQVVNFFSGQELDLGKTLCSLRSLLPKSIAPLKLEKVHDTFHPSLDAESKEYHYWICNLPTQFPHHRMYSWHCPLPLDQNAMKEASLLLIGKRDFSALANERYEDPIRTLMRIEICPQNENRFRIEVKGDRFLYKMVRNLVGMLVAVGRGKISVQEIPDILESRDRRLAAMTAPAHGLTLKRVYY